MLRIEKILVPIDFSEPSNMALQHAIALAKRFKAQVHVLRAYHLPVQVAAMDQVVLPKDFWTGVRDSAARKLEKALEKITLEGAKGETHMTEAVPTQGIVDLARKLKVDLIVMGTRGLTGLKHVMLGSVAERTVRLAPCPVLTVKGDESVPEEGRYRVIVVPMDFSAEAHRALEVARGLAKDAGFFLL